MIADNVLQRILHEDDVISFDRLAAGLVGTPNVLYTKTDFLLRGGVWRGEVCDSAIRRLRRGDASVVVYGLSDLSITRPQVWALRALGAKAIWGVNVVSKRAGLRALPLGLCDPNNDGPTHRLLGDVSLLTDVLETHERSTRFSGRIYFNFTVGNHFVRDQVLSVAKQLPRSIVEQPQFSRLGRHHYLRQLRQADLVACPRGNGWDTHRLWETLYVGGTPVVLDDDAAKNLLHSLPVVRIQAWDDLSNEGLMEELWNRVYQRSDSDLDVRRSTYLRRIMCDAGLQNEAGVGRPLRDGSQEPERPS